MFKLTKTLLIGAVLAAALSVTAFAEGNSTPGYDPGSGGAGYTAEVRPEVKPADAGTITGETLPPDAAVSSVVTVPPVNEVMMGRQSEIDKALFETYAKDIAAKGFMVTHTAPLDSYVEVGISPYNEENSSYISSLIGSEQVKIVEGQQAVPLSSGEEAQLYTTTAVDTDAVTTSAPEEVKTTAMPEDKVVSSFNYIPVIIGLGSLVLLGIVFIALKKLNLGKK